MSKLSESIEPERPARLDTFTEEVSTGCGKAYITCTPYRKGEYFEIKGLLGKSGNCPAAHLDGLSRMINEAINRGARPKNVAKSLREIRCPNDSKFLKSCPAALAQVVEEAIKKEWQEETHKTLSSKETS